LPGTDKTSGLSAESGEAGWQKGEKGRESGEFQRVLPGEMMEFLLNSGWIDAD
jgi:hypothetical protein